MLTQNERYEMYKVFLYLAVVFFVFGNANAGDIKYGYNNRGDYLPVEVNDKKVEY